MLLVDASFQLRQSDLRYPAALTTHLSDRAPELVSVLGNLEILRKYIPDDAKLLRLIDGAIQGAERGATLTKRMLAFARRQELQPTTVAANAPAKSVLMQPLLGS